VPKARSPKPSDICVFSGEDLPPAEFIPIALFSKSGVFAVEALRRQVCPSGPDCECGGGYESWFRIQGLSDLSDKIPDRPLFASQDDVGVWFQVEQPEGFVLEEWGIGKRRTLLREEIGG
jgi:hypothetical protein